MIILLISSNPLFKEVIQEATSKGILSKAIEVEPDSAPAKICETMPEVIIIDEAIGAEKLEKILAAARELSKARTILLNPQKNDIVLINSHRRTLEKVEDLMDAVMRARTGVSE